MEIRIVRMLILNPIRRYSDAANYENKARDEEREVDSLKREIDNLWDELNRL